MAVDYNNPEDLRRVAREVARLILGKMAKESINDYQTLKIGLIGMLLEHKRIGPFVAAMGPGQVYKILNDAIDINDLL